MEVLAAPEHSTTNSPFHGFWHAQTTFTDKLWPHCKIVAEIDFAAGCDLHCAHDIQSPQWLAGRRLVIPIELELSIGRCFDLIEL